jgi:hypothetical protein
VAGEDGIFRKETTMSRDARIQDQDLELSPAARQKFDELVAVLAKQGFGDGPPRDTTFAAIERFGHQAGRMLGRALDTHLLKQHAEHFVGEEPCPKCAQKHVPKEHPFERPLQTEDGSIAAAEPAFHCSPCGRDFFPSAHPTAD